MVNRNRDFKLGIIHGKIQPDKEKSEASIQRNLFLHQRIVIKRGKYNECIVRLFAYEMPLGLKRDECIDLVGYDKDFNLFLIELKSEESKEHLSEVVQQLNNYEKRVKEIKRSIEKDFKKTFYLHIKFTDIKKAILAPKMFYYGKTLDDDTIEYLYVKPNDVKKFTTNLIEKNRFDNPVVVHNVK